MSVVIDPAVQRREVRMPCAWREGE